MFGWRREKRSRKGAQDKREKILITGTGRAGTTLLVQLFTALDFDTGYSFEQAMGDVDPISRAGLERLDAGPDAPYVIKSPIYSDMLLPLLAGQDLRLHCAIVPLRDLFSAAQSRRRVTAEAINQGGDPEAEHPGGLWLTRNPEEQEAKLAVQFFKVMYALTVGGVTPVTMEFPRFAQEPDYLFERLKPLLTEHGVARAEFDQAFARVVRPERIHSFPANAA